MSVLSDLYLAQPSHARDYDVDQSCLDIDRAQYKGITTLELSTLVAIIKKQVWDFSMMDQFAEIMSVNVGERLIFEIPRFVMECFASLTEAEIGIAADKWSKTDELACEADDIQPVIEEIVRLSIRGRETNRSLYLWICI